MFSDSEHLPILSVGAVELTDSTVAWSYTSAPRERGGMACGRQMSPKPRTSGVKLCPGLSHSEEA